MNDLTARLHDDLLRNTFNCLNFYRTNQASSAEALSGFLILLNYSWRFSG